MATTSEAKHVNDSSEQLLRLERSVRNLRLGTLCLVAALVSLILLGAADSQELTLRRLVIADAKGGERIRLETDTDGNGSFSFLDASGTGRFTVRVLPDGIAALSALDRNGKLGAMMSTFPDGSTGFTTFGTDKKRRAQILTTASGSSLIAFYDSAESPQVPRATLGVENSGVAGFSLANREGKGGIMMATGDNAEFALIDPSGINRIELLAPAEGRAVIQSLDGQGNMRINIGTLANGGAAIMLLDSAGQQSWMEASGPAAKPQGGEKESK